MSLFSSWRGSQEWKNIGLPLSTGSNEACRLYDAVLTQYVGWYDDNSVGGLEAAAEQMIQADPEFVLGHVLVNGLDVMGTGRSTRLDDEFKRSIENMVKLATKSSGLTEREKKHATAVKLWADGYCPEACLVWEDILVSHPTDMLAIKFAHDSYFYLGFQPQMRDSIARVISQWTPDMPLYSYLLGMHSFGLVETNMFEEAEKVAKKGLEMNARDAWSTHSLAHVLEMTGRQNEGIAFMSSTLSDWEPCGMLACHNFWHWAVYHIEKGEYQAALDIYDNECGVRCKSGALLDIVDVCSMLNRLQFEGVDVGDRWESLYEICRPHIDDHILVFNDVHLLSACLGAKQTDTVNKMMDSMKEFVTQCDGFNKNITAKVGLAICEAFIAYSDGDFAKAVDLFLPIRYDVVKIGGSNAQRDMFHLFLINAALRSPSKHHHRLARHLLYERKALKQCAPMTDRLIGRAMALHAD